MRTTALMEWDLVESEVKRVRELCGEGLPVSIDVCATAHGTVKLAVTAIGGADRFHADILSHGKSIDADFRYANSARGPPGTDPVRKKIIVVGEMRAISLPESFQNSESDTHVLDLDPSPQALAEYKDALSRYEASMQAYDLAQQQGQERRQGEDANRDHESETSHPVTAPHTIAP